MNLNVGVRFGLGLRAQIILALAIAFTISFSLLGVAMIELMTQTQRLVRYQDAKGSAEKLARDLIDTKDRSRADTFRSASSVLIGRNGVEGIELIRRGISPVTRGNVRGRTVEAPIDGRSKVRIWYQMPARADSKQVTDLVLLYVAITGGAILLLLYVILTYLIVRPLESVTRASERLASGSYQTRVPEQGAKEVIRLAESFNEMSRQLRSEKSALENRLLELEQTTAELAATQNQLVRSEKLASVGRLSAGVAHEIGNPLAAILGLIELLRAGDLAPDDQQEFLKRIHTETERINKIIRDLLGFARQNDSSDAGDASSNLCDVVEDAVRLIAPQKDLLGVTIERRLENEVPMARVSPEQATQLVLNLLLNAADAIQGDGAIQVEVATGEEPGTVSLVVADSGPGIDPEVLDNLFEPFVTTKPTGQGTGLGLAVVHNIVDRAGGIIVASNREAGGARFEVTLPAAQ